MADSEATFIAFALAALGGSALYAAYKNQSWLSVVESTVSPKRFSVQRLPPSDAFSETGSTAGDVVSSSASSAHADSIHQKAVDYAYSKLGDPYQWAASGPSKFDCSGLTMECARAAGYNMPHNAELQWQQTRRYKLAKTTDPPAGTFVYYGHAGFADHCGISIGGGNMIEAPHTGDVVKIYNIANEVQFLPLVGITDPLSHVKGK